MMSEMTRYKHQRNIDEDETSIGSNRTEDISAGTTHIRYHMGSSFWKTRTKLEKFLILSWIVMLVSFIVIILIVIHWKMGKNRTILMHLPPTQNECIKPECIKLAGRILDRMNSSVDPCNDFYQYACGGWLAKTVKPPGYALWGTLSQIESENQIVLKKALESDHKAFSESEVKAKQYYHSCIDSNNTVEKRGPKPLIDLITKVGGWPLFGKWNAEDYDLQLDVIKTNLEFSGSGLFYWGIKENDKDSSSYIIQIDQSGLFLAARDYYLNETGKNVVDAYVSYFTKVGVLLGADENDSREVAKSMVEFETKLAEISASDEDRRDSEKLYNLMKLSDLTELAPFLDWTVFLNAAFKTVNRSVMPQTEVIVSAPDYLKKLSEILLNMTSTEEGKTVIHNYLIWHMAKSYLVFLPKSFRDAYTIIEKEQVGVSGYIESWRECVQATELAFSDVVSELYVRSTFSKQAKKEAQNLLVNIRSSFAFGVSHVRWMDQMSKRKAIDKANSIIQMIGYSDSILDPKVVDKKYSDLKISEDFYFENSVNVTAFKNMEALNKYFKPVNKSSWDMPAPTVNAYYSPPKNSIVFLAGILQPPLFREDYPLAINYGSVGVVMGHELSHAFDDQGRKYDKNGNLKNWWKNETIEHFNLRARCIVDQYSNYTFGHEHLKGNMTLGENIADNGGLKASFVAYQDLVQHQNAKDFVLPGIDLTSNQLFFLSFAQVWCSTMTKEAAHLEILKDSHVLPEFRVKGTLSNSKEFANAFRCPKNAPMNPSHKCKVW